MMINAHKSDQPTIARMQCQTIQTCCVLVLVLLEIMRSYSTVNCAVTYVNPDLLLGPTTQTTTSMSATIISTANKKGTFRAKKSRQDFEHSCQPIANPKRLEFIHIPRTGGTALEALAASHNVSWGACHYISSINMAGKCPRYPDKPVPSRPQHPIRSSPWHVPLRYYYHPKPFWAVNSTLFMVVRNPYSRVMSEFNFPAYHPPPGMRNNATFMNEQVMAWMNKVESNRPQLAPNGTITTAKIGVYFLRDAHCVPQSDYWEPGVVVLRHETLEQDLSCLLQAYSTNHKNWSLAQRQSVNKAAGNLTVADLTKSTRAAIARVYAQDFLQFGYPV